VESLFIAKREVVNRNNEKQKMALINFFYNNNEIVATGSTIYETIDKTMPYLCSFIQIKSAKWQGY